MDAIVNAPIHIIIPLLLALLTRKPPLRHCSEGILKMKMSLNLRRLLCKMKQKKTPKELLKAES
jgi:hypothetical protein